MATQGGLKHAATEPSQLDNKREGRRRAGTGSGTRAAALRRAPSDSDCSGETASLSADSVDRVRPALPTTRQAKTRSRRRGSEWEVLEGLKDGQRFERRPEVFNGYLHKKRKWPLKGWHKRFFVVDGGILVYARSPTDVARGRLHGSVDVGLSVISAKARRRRIDIDADEFIYHLRAKTPDVFRTWLNVLKAHRLYRQHLLTFGARESTPKIHAPLEDIPPTDNSSQLSSSSTESLSRESTSLLLNTLKTPKPFTNNIIPCYTNVPVYEKNKENHISNWFFEAPNTNEVVPLNFETIEEGSVITENTEDVNADLYNHSLCSMNCVAQRYQKYFESIKPLNISSGVTQAEKQINNSDLDRNSPDLGISSASPTKIVASVNKDIIKPAYPVFYAPRSPAKSRKDKAKNKNKLPTEHRMAEPTTALFLFSKKKKRVRSNSLDTPMKRSKKSTNVVKYKNVADEPPLKKPISKGMLLNKYHNKSIAQSNHSCEAVFDNDRETIEQVNTEIKEETEAPNANPNDKNIEMLIMTILGSRENTINCVTIKDYVDEMVKEMNNLKLAQHEIHPVKILLKHLLEYWLKNALPDTNETMKCVRSKNVQTNYVTRDQNESSFLINCVHKQTQFQDMSPGTCKSIPTTISYLMERKIQQLERVLKNTVYTFENTNTGKDIETTIKLIDDIEKQKKASEVKKVHSDPSHELHKIQETFNNLFNETALSPDVAKDLLHAYLGVLQNDSDKASSVSTDESKGSKETPKCQVQAESIVKNVSKEVLTSIDEGVNEEKQTMIESAQNPEQLYLKGVLDKVTKIFSKVNTQNEQIHEQKVIKQESLPNIASKDLNKDSFRKRVSVTKEKNSIAIDLTKYDVENISMMNNSGLEGAMSIVVKLKERSFDVEQKYSIKEKIHIIEDENAVHSKKSAAFKESKPIYKNNLLNFKNSYLDYEKDGHKEKFELRPFVSSSDGTSKGYKAVYYNQSDRTLCSQKSSKDSLIVNESRDGHDDVQSYFVMSDVKKALSSIFQIKKKVRVNEPRDHLYPSRASSDSNVRNESTSNRAAVDETFILLLLENLTLLSMNMPTLHKDISSVYNKLKKKHDRDRKNQKARVGLLGQIYETRKVDNETQFEQEVAEGKSDVYKTISNKCIHADLELTNKVDRPTSVIICTTAKDFTGQADEETVKKTKSPKILQTYDKNQTYGISFDTEKHKTGPSKSKRNWFDSLKTDNALNKIIKCLIENKGSCRNFRVKEECKTHRNRKTELRDSCQSFKFVLLSDNNKGEKDKIEKDTFGWSKMQTELDVENIHSIKRVMKVNKDYNVYQLFMSSKYRTSGSLSGSNIECRDLSDDLKTIYRCVSDPSYCSGLISPTSPPLRGPQAGFVAGTPGGRLAGWIIESGGPLENATRELGQAQLSVQQLQRLLDALELQQHHHDTDQVSLEGASPNVKKDRRKFGLRKKKSNSKCASVDLAPPLHVDASTSHMTLSALTAPPSPGGAASSMPTSAASLPIACAAARPQSLPGTEALAAGVGPASLSSLTPDQQLREDFTVLAKDLLGTLKGVVSTLVCERGRLRAAMESGESSGGGAVVAALRTNLTSALQQNSELRSRLSRIHDASDLAEISSVNNSDPVCRQFPQSLSYSSSCVSASEFFDAEEHEAPPDLLPADEAGVIELDGDSSSEAGSLSSEDGSASSDNSEAAIPQPSPTSVQNGVELAPALTWSRRTTLPAPRPTPGGPSLWNLLYKNIGKDLSQVSMPVTINEPLNMLQRLCEELEYSSLLDQAALCTSGTERMSWVAAFAVSAYHAGAHRAASKPFNPLLHETYECTRPDRGFRFLAEQVSHHPPISACHAESPNWVFWQEARIKTKFWGKSMEFQPAGRVHVRLLPAGDHYSWNKVTTCVHNLFGGQRWVDQYGDMHIVCHDSDISCKLQFIKASSWSSSRHEVRGAVSSGAGRLRLHGRWSEALLQGDPPHARCLWRPGAMPPDHDLYYGFTRFAIELNEMEPGLRELLPHTDTRLRPDQRALEEGAVEAAEQYKAELEQAQRDRRRDQQDVAPCWFRKSSEDGEEMWVFTGEYWRARDNGFPDLHVPRLW